jgi:hypothetical protein
MASAHDETTNTMTESRTDPPNAAPADGPPKPAGVRPPSHRWLEQLILFRVIQGLAGGGLQPASQGILIGGARRGE